MATDATGTPTPLGIPKYNTAGDPPSGKGFNATMDSIDSILTTLLAAKAPLASPTLTGNPLAPTPAPGDNDTSIATTAFVAAAMAALVPAGTIAKTAALAAPSGWVLADGSVVSRTGANAALFAAIGTTYGAGDGVNTFGLPNLKGRVPIHPDGGTFGAIGSTGGEAAHALSIPELAAHDHGTNTSAVSAGTPAGSLSSDSAGTPTGTNTAISAGTPAGTVVAASAGTPTGTINVVRNGGAVAVNSIQYNVSNQALAGSVTDVATFAGDPMGTHAHTFTGSALGTHNHTFTGNAMTAHTHTFTGSALGTHAHVITSQGSGTAHNNIQPYIVINHIIKL